MICNRLGLCYLDRGRPEGFGPVYVCNCNGIREREAHAAIQAGACRPAEIFRTLECSPRCAKCVCDMRRMIQQTEQSLKYAAE